MLDIVITEIDSTDDGVGVYYEVTNLWDRPVTDVVVLPVSPAIANPTSTDGNVHVMPAGGTEEGILSFPPTFGDTEYCIEAVSGRFASEMACEIEAGPSSWSRSAAGGFR